MMTVIPYEKRNLRINVPAVDPQQCYFDLMGKQASAMDFGNSWYNDRGDKVLCSFGRDSDKRQKAMKKFGINASDFDAICDCLEFALYAIPCQRGNA